MFLIGREKSDVMKNELDKENQEKYDKLIRIIVLINVCNWRRKKCDVMTMSQTRKIISFYYCTYDEQEASC